MSDNAELQGIEFQLKEMNRLKVIELKFNSLVFDYQISLNKESSKIKNDVINELFEINRSIAKFEEDNK